MAGDRDASASDANNKEDEKVMCEPDSRELCGAEEHNVKFNPTDYLESFYKSATEDTAMQIVLFFLPGILYRLPQKVESVLDLGAGPTVYLPIALRDRAENIYTSDYAPANRDALQAWCEDRSTFDWTNVCKWLSSIEASNQTPADMQKQARDKMRAVLEVNVHHDNAVVKGAQWNRGGVEVPKQFEVVTTVFCLEYSCEDLEGYNRAVRNACSLIKPGGYLVQGGVLEATDYSFGDTRFKCHKLYKNHILNSLAANGMATKDEDGYKFITHDEIFILVAKKIK